MNQELTDYVDEVVALCTKFGVKRLDVFGSVTGPAFGDDSDIDFLVEFDPPEGLSRFDAYFGLKEALEDLFGRPVDLVDPSALENPFFAAEVEKTRREFYAA